MAQKNSKPVAKVMPKTSARKSDSKPGATVAALRDSLSVKQATGYRVGRIVEADKYEDGSA